MFLQQHSSDHYSEASLTMTNGLKSGSGKALTHMNFGIKIDNMFNKCLLETYLALVSRALWTSKLQVKGLVQYIESKPTANLGE